MKKWGSRHPVLVLVMALVLCWGTGLAVSLVIGGRLDDALFSATMGSISTALIWYFTVRRLRRTSDRLTEHGQRLVYLRYPEARPGSLSGIWNMGVATLSPGRIDFQPAVYDTLEPSGRPSVLEGLEGVSVPRRLNRQDAKHVTQRMFMVMTYKTSGGTVEIAASPECLQQIRETVLQPPVA
ncbi:hypothetical protein [Arthrobacter sp. NPDC057013]|uniref:hypothetical protein n=1 Tax=Arthrobacter sp. NPDC057013 TaxID=3345999 RepID=UPI0036336D79